VTGEPSKYPWWARSTGGNRGAALTLAITYTALFTVNAVTWFIEGSVWNGLLALGFSVLAAWGWAVVVYLRRRPKSGDEPRGW
jgi:hypothetical protein